MIVAEEPRASRPRRFFRSSKGVALHFRCKARIGRGRAKPVYNRSKVRFILSAALDPPGPSTLAVIRRETGSWKWPFNGRAAALSPNSAHFRQM
jgi:hypothetical protein